MDLFNRPIFKSYFRKLREKDLIVWTISIISIVFLLSQLLIGLGSLFFVNNNIIASFISTYFYLPPTFTQLPFRFYTLFTYQFFHDTLWHWLFNCVLLYFLGSLLKFRITNKQLVLLFLGGGVLGGLLWVLFTQYQIIKIDTIPMLGSSASLMSLWGAALILYPNYSIKLFFKWDVALKWFVYALGLLIFFGLFSSASSGSALVHLAGLLVGVVLSYVMFFSRSFHSVEVFFKNIFKKKLVVKEVYVNPSKVQKAKVSLNQQEKVDAILDKISAHGYDSLSKEEKEFLFSTSKN